MHDVYVSVCDVYVYAYVQTDEVLTCHRGMAHVLSDQYPLVSVHCIMCLCVVIGELCRGAAV